MHSLCFKCTSVFWWFLFLWFQHRSFFWIPETHLVGISSWVFKMAPQITLSWSEGIFFPQILSYMPYLSKWCYHLPSSTNLKPGCLSFLNLLIPSSSASKHHQVIQVSLTVYQVLARSTIPTDSNSTISHYNFQSRLLNQPPIIFPPVKPLHFSSVLWMNSIWFPPILCLRIAAIVYKSILAVSLDFYSLFPKWLPYFYFPA